MAGDVRRPPAPGDVQGDDHEAAHDDTGRVAPGNSTLPATALLQLWPLLPTLRLVVERGGVRPAAEALGVQAPAVSKAIRHLESALGETLFLRVGRSLVPTDRARQIHRDVRAAMRLIDSGLHPDRPLRLVVHPALTQRVLEATRGSAVGHIQQLESVVDAMTALRNGIVDGVVGCGHIDVDPGLEVELCGVVTEVEVGGDVGVYDGEDGSAAIMAVRSGYRAWVVAAFAPADLEVRRRRERPWWLAIRRHTSNPTLLQLGACLKSA